MIWNESLHYKFCEISFELSNLRFLMFLSLCQQTYTNGKTEFDLRSGYFPVISVLVFPAISVLVLVLFFLSF